MLIMLEKWKKEKTEVILNYYNGLGIRGYIKNYDSHGVVFKETSCQKLSCIPYGAIKSICEEA